MYIQKEVLEGKVRIDGEVEVYVIYLADSENEETRSLATSVDFYTNYRFLKIAIMVWV